METYVSNKPIMVGFTFVLAFVLSCPALHVLGDSGEFGSPVDAVIRDQSEPATRYFELPLNTVDFKVENEEQEGRWVRISFNAKVPKMENICKYTTADGKAKDCILLLQGDIDMRSPVRVTPKLGSSEEVDNESTEETEEESSEETSDEVTKSNEGSALSESCDSLADAGSVHFTSVYMNNTCYVLSSYQHARAYCNTQAPHRCYDFPGFEGSLAVVQDQQLESTLLKLVKSKVNYDNAPKGACTGLMKTDAEWKWIGNKGRNYTEGPLVPWSESESKGGQGCAIIHKDKSLVDFNCDKNYFWLCQYSEKICYYKKQKGFASKDSFRTFNVVDRTECGEHCCKNPMCRSFNYKNYRCTLNRCNSQDKCSSEEAGTTMYEKVSNIEEANLSAGDSDPETDLVQKCRAVHNHPMTYSIYVNGTCYVGHKLARSSDQKKLFNCIEAMAACNDLAGFSGELLTPHYFPLDEIIRGRFINTNLMAGGCIGLYQEKNQNGNLAWYWKGNGGQKYAARDVSTKTDPERLCGYYDNNNGFKPTGCLKSWDYMCQYREPTSYYKRQSSAKPATHSIAEFEGISSKEGCAKKCHRASICLSYSYSPSTRKCSLHDCASWQNCAMKSETQGFDRYDKITDKTEKDVTYTDALPTNTDLSEKCMDKDKFDYFRKYINGSCYILDKDGKTDCTNPSAASSQCNHIEGYVGHTALIQTKELYDRLRMEFNHKNNGKGICMGLYYTTAGNVWRLGIDGIEWPATFAPTDPTPKNVKPTTCYGMTKNFLGGMNGQGCKNSRFICQYDEKIKYYELGAENAQLGHVIEEKEFESRQECEVKCSSIPICRAYSYKQGRCLLHQCNTWHDCDRNQSNGFKVYDRL